MRDVLYIGFMLVKGGVILRRRDTQVVGATLGVCFQSVACTFWGLELGSMDLERLAREGATVRKRWRTRLIRARI